MSNNGDGDGFVRVMESEEDEEVMELPAEDDNTILLSTLQGQFPNAVGLKYRSASGGWRGVRISGEALNPPNEGWGDRVYMVTMPKDSGVKRKLNEEPEQVEGPVKKTKEEVTVKKLSASERHLLGDMIVLNLPFKCKDSDLKEYFTSACGEMALCDVKVNRDTKKSRGFGFIRFKTVEGAKAALTGEHSIMGRKVEIKSTKKKEEEMKLFIGRIPTGTTAEELKEYFGEFGEILDGYIPSPFRGFGFVTYVSAFDGRAALRRSHQIKGVKLNVEYAEPKEEKERRKREEQRNLSSNTGSWGPGGSHAFNENYDNSHQMMANRDSRDRNQYNDRDQYDYGMASHDGSAELRNMLYSFIQGGYN